ncbi:SLC13 family permease [Youngiibacter fragilis]|uniref:Citrate transporter n=1 Tax=Youngiibacter fragilis 232.1 TaxID=994573 RepID=V7IBC1_9CLOT|nr:SLC13 family permease [Youngiibacter fragilis]ETA82586.1 citrate transporter [Youngiibacter fragilis 232.1]
MYQALAILIVTYFLIIALPKARAQAAFVSAVVFVLLGYVPIREVLPSIDWNVILMIRGMMGLVALFIESGMPSRLADLIIWKMPDVKWAIIVLAALAAGISAFVDNVATVLIIAPVAISVSKKLRISPVPAVVSIAIASSLEGAATMVGDTTSIMLGSHAGMDFLDFFWHEGRPGLFFVVQLGLLFAVQVMLYLFRDYDQQISGDDLTMVRDYVPTILLGAVIALLSAASLIPDKPPLTNGLICITLMAIGTIMEAARKKDLSKASRLIKGGDAFTLVLLASLFVVIRGVSNAGVIDWLSVMIADLAGDNLFLAYSFLLWGSVLLSAFIDNIPYVATMLPVVTVIASRLGMEPHILYFGLICGATLGGNLTPVGASANITALGLLRNEDIEVSAIDFMKISVPFTLAAVTSAYSAVWYLWGTGF